MDPVDLALTHSIWRRVAKGLDLRSIDLDHVTHWKRSHGGVSGTPQSVRPRNKAAEHSAKGWKVAAERLLRLA